MLHTDTCWGSGQRRKSWVLCLSLGPNFSGSSNKLITSRIRFTTSHPPSLSSTALNLISLLQELRLVHASATMLIIAVWDCVFFSSYFLAEWRLTIHFTELLLLLYVKCMCNIFAHGIGGVLLSPLSPLCWHTGLMARGLEHDWNIWPVCFSLANYFPPNINIIKKIVNKLYSVPQY